MRELYGLEVDPDEFKQFTGTGEANFLGGVARKYGAPFELESCKVGRGVLAKRGSVTAGSECQCKREGQKSWALQCMPAML